MNYEKKLPSNSVKIFVATTLLCLATWGLSAFVTGCAPTVRPVVLHATTASWDGNKQNSGLIGLDAQKNAILTVHAKDRYNALMDAYGGRFSPPVKAGDGITATATNTFLLDAQHFVYFTAAARIRLREQ